MDPLIEKLLALAVLTALSAFLNLKTAPGLLKALTYWLLIAGLIGVAVLTGMVVLDA